MRRLLRQGLHQSAAALMREALRLSGSDLGGGLPLL